MKISVKVDYACRVMAELARLHGTGELAQIEHLARVEAVPANFLAQILGKGKASRLYKSLVYDKKIAQDCSACHEMLAMDEAAPKILTDLGITQ